MAQWSAYDFTVFENDGRKSYKASTLGSLFHILHVPDAEEVVRKQKIKAKPVYDQSVLNTTRVHVVWLSPNDWSDGSIYGNVRLSFDWEDLITGRSIFWAEVITTYRRPAPRFFISDKSVGQLNVNGLIQSYDPTKDDGPLKKVGSDWFWNNDVTLEIMLDADIDLSICKKLEIVKHHASICRGKGTECNYKGDVVSKPGAEFLAYIIGSEVSVVNDAWTPDIGLSSRYHSDLQYAVMGLQSRLTKNINMWNGPINNSSDSRSIIKAACLQVSMNNDREAVSLISLLESEDIFKSALTKTLRRHFGIPTIKLI